MDSCGWTSTFFVKYRLSDLSLVFSTGDQIEVSKAESGAPLEVCFRDKRTVLHPQHSGPLEPTGARSVEEFREEFLTATQRISVECIHTGRRPDNDISDLDIEREHFGNYPPTIRHTVGQRRRIKEPDLADRIRQFIANAQVNYRRFFQSNEPDFLSAIIQRLQQHAQPNPTIDQLLERLAAVREQEQAYARLGVERSQWDFDLARSYLAELTEPTAREGLSVMTAAAEVLESRAREQQLLAERLLTFERIVNGYFRDKTIKVGPRKGLDITTPSGEHLTEEVLSSGEYHLLYLMVAALTTQRRGTVLAIDEPELSMHISWQRQLIDSLLECASNASPQLLLATHSPDIVGKYRDYLVEFGSADELAR